ncbi:hypothetical protein RhiirC2_793667 [Rhizophagus irregularis]|uniref:Uncharacterized protein n=1 Tax=Rhizophagus irregularis TaxID=588596 RepID=A0A2N1MF04_9GLOM|nr:hypothetical protein RhiirC2_793667 [Rhizophagus irregularis]
MANKYKISTQRVYQIWRGAHSPIDPKDIKPLSEEPGSYQQADPVECNIISESKVKKTGGKKTKSKSVYVSESPVILTQLAPMNSEGLNIKLDAFYEKEARREKINRSEMNRRLAM